KSLEKHKQYVTSFGHLQNAAMIGGVHSLAPATWLSGMKPERGSKASMSTTLDQVILQQLGVLLQHHALVPRRALAAAGGIQPAQDLRGTLRRRRHAGGTRGDLEPD